MKVNINQWVKIKLTPHGINVLAERHKELKKFAPMIKDFKMPEIDKDGYTRYQLWSVMEIFSGFVGMGVDLPFEPEIEIEE